MSGRQAFVECALLRVPLGGDTRAPGGAVTVELCGHWEHDGACRWPHHTGASPPGEGGEFGVRVLFACPPEEEPEVRLRIGRALRSGRTVGPGGPLSWEFVEHRAEPVSDADREHAARLVE